MKRYKSKLTLFVGEFFYRVKLDSFSNAIYFIAYTKRERNQKTQLI